jgi:hypothetical protein
MSTEAHVVHPQTDLASLREAVDEAAARIARLPHGAGRDVLGPALADYAIAQDNYRRFRNRWVRGGSGVRGGTV